MPEEPPAFLEGFVHDGVFWLRRGRSAATAVRHKLCLVSRDLEALAATLSELADEAHCVVVKLSPRAKDGMYIGRCAMADLEMVGRTWQRLRKHPKLWCSVQDDAFVLPFRDPAGLERARIRKATLE